jgi:hypothetical protein
MSPPALQRHCCCHMPKLLLLPCLACVFLPLLM